MAGPLSRPPNGCATYVPGRSHRSAHRPCPAGNPGVSGACIPQGIEPPKCSISFILASRLLGKVPSVIGAAVRHSDWISHPLGPGQGGWVVPE